MIHKGLMRPCVRDASDVRPDAAERGLRPSGASMRPATPFRGAGDAPHGRTHGVHQNDLIKINKGGVRPGREDDRPDRQPAGASGRPTRTPSQ